ncbi:PepSY domain-containing protein [Terriglobus sp.]|uniref:PepSY domain-containing protein n=1 Tax=Terriglobus sp. TaxID=1889013 RepID=UPI003B009C1A
MSFKRWLRSWWGEDWHSKRAILSKEIALDRVKQHAAANNLPVTEPVNVDLENHWINPKSASEGSRPVYVFYLGDSRPTTTVKVDAVNGAVFDWHTPYS